MAKNGTAASTDYQAQDDMETLLRAHAIRSDGKRHAAAKAHAKTKLKAMKGVLDAEDDPKKGGDGGKDEATEKS